MATHTMIPLEDRGAWDAALDGVPHAFAHTWESCAAMHLTTGHPTSLYVFEEGEARVVCAIAEREFRGARDVVTPYGFGGFASRGVHEGFAAAWREFARGQGWVCGYIGLNPLLARHEHCLPEELHARNEIHALDLRTSTDEMLGRLSQNRRREIRAWSSSARLVDDREALARFLLEHYDAFMAERGASAAYRFSRRTWDALLDSPRVMLVGSARDGAVEAATMLAYTPHVGDFLFGVSTPSGRSSSAPLLWEGALRLRSLGVPWLNLGGGVRPGDGVARFKERFGGHALPLHSARQVYDEPRFAALCREAGVSPLDRSGYFPPYHAT